MQRSILVTGGAGFIGSFVVDALVERGHRVRILDSLEEQVHQGQVPSYRNPHAEFIHGDVRDLETVASALAGIDTVIHCAAAVGVAQSQYEIKRYTDINVGGTANLLDCIVNRRLPVRKILMPSSMTSYGEGAYQCDTHGRVRPGVRPASQLATKDWQIHCPQCRHVVQPVPVREDDTRESSTIYALTKNMQEDMFLSTAATYGIPATCFRLFNVFGPRQSLSNPYTGVMAIFASRIKNQKPPVIFEDGEQSRDFISVHDVVRAFLLALDSDAANGRALNLGSGHATSIRQVALEVARAYGSDIQPLITGDARKNDIRHCIADTTLARTLLGWEPQTSFEDGLRELIAWSHDERAEDHFDDAHAKLLAQKLTA